MIRGGTRFESSLFTNFAPESDFFSSLLVNAAQCNAVRPDLGQRHKFGCGGAYYYHQRQRAGPLPPSVISRRTDSRSACSAANVLALLPGRVGLVMPTRLRQRAKTSAFFRCCSISVGRIPDKFFCR